MKRLFRPRLLLLLWALALAACLALPFGVFALWDGVLFSTPQPVARPQSPAPLSQAGRENSLSCLLYLSAHTLELPIPAETARTELWQAQTPTDEEARLACGRAAQVLQGLQQAGLLTPAELAPGLDALAGSPQPSLLAAPSGLWQLSLWQKAQKGRPQVSLTLVCTPDDLPVYCQYTHDAMPQSDPARPDSLQQARALLGLDCFADWQEPAAERLGSHVGAVCYSPAAQLYLTVNCEFGLTMALASMPPDAYAALLGAA